MTHLEREDYWQQQLDHWRDSGLSGAAYCQRHELTYHQFTYWRRKLRETDSKGRPPEGASGFARVTTLPVTEARELTLTLPGGMAIIGLNADNIHLLGALLRQL